MPDSPKSKGITLDLTLNELNRKRFQELKAPHKFHIVSPSPWQQEFAEVGGVEPTGHGV